MSKLEFPLLTADQIEVKVKKVSEKGAVLLLYKTARTDMDMLDNHQEIGPANWACDYREIKGNLYCGIGIRFGDEWVWKWDCGIESRADGDGNEKKGEASDAFKRTGFRIGIGRELYTSPFIFASVPVESSGVKSYKLKNPFEKFTVAEIDYDNRKISKLRIVNSKGEEVYSYGTFSKPHKNPPKSKEPAIEPPKPPQSIQEEPASQEPPKKRMATEDQILFIFGHAGEDLLKQAQEAFGIELERMSFVQATKIMGRINNG